MTDTIVEPQRPVTDEDPRIAERRRGVLGAARRRRRIVLGAVAAVLGVVTVAVGLARSPLFAVDRVVVTGARTVDRSAVVAASHIRRGDAIVDVDAARVRADVMAVPMVASARVERVWPRTVRIVVTEERPLAVVEVGGRALTVGRGGRILAAVSGGGTPHAPTTGQPAPGQHGAPAGLQRIVVADGVTTGIPSVGRDVPAVLAPAVVVVEQLPPLLAGRMQEVDVGPGGALSLVLGADAGRVAMGAPEDVPTKLLAVESILAAVDLDCLDVLDVREPTRPTVSRRPGCALAAPTVTPR